MESRRIFFVVLLFRVIAVLGTKPFVLDRNYVGSEEKNTRLLDVYFKTLEENEIKFDSHDVELLKEPYDFQRHEMNEVKKEVLTKYDRKCAALLCVNNLILLYILHNINSSMLNGRIPKLENKNDFETYKTHVARMLSVLYYFRIPALDVTVYAELIVAINPETYEEFIDEDFLSDEGNLATFKLCQDNTLVPKKEQDVSVEDYLKSIDIDDIITRLYCNEELESKYTVYDNAKLFTPEQITLAHIFNRMPVLYTILSWIKPLGQPNLDLVELGDVYQTHQWPFFLDRHVNYHYWVVQITFTSFMYHLWYHLKQCQILMNKRPENAFMKRLKSKTTRRTPKMTPLQYWSLIADPLKQAVAFFDMYDNLTSEIMEVVSRDSAIALRDLAFYEQAVKKILLVSLKTIGVSNAGSIVEVPVMERKTTKILIKTNIEAFIKYTSDVKEALCPIDNLFFIKLVSKQILKNNNIDISPFLKTYDNVFEPIQT